MMQDGEKVRMLRAGKGKKRRATWAPPSPRVRALSTEHCGMEPVDSASL